MEVTINYNGQAVAVEVTLEVYEFLDRADHKAENLSHEQRRHWDGREFDEYIVATEGVGIYRTPCRSDRFSGLYVCRPNCRRGPEGFVFPRLKRYMGHSCLMFWGSPA